MEKGCPPHESAPPYEGPAMSEGWMGPRPMSYPQPAFSPGAPPPHVGSLGGHYPGMSPHPGMSHGAPPPSGYPGVPPPEMYAQPGFSPAAPPAGYPGGVPYASVVQAAPTTVVTQIMVSPSLRDTSGRAVCPHCQQSVVTNIEHTAGWMTWLGCAASAAMGCFVCCWIPFVIDSCKDVEHRCPSCKNLIFIYRRNEHYGRSAYAGHGYL